MRLKMLIKCMLFLLIIFLIKDTIISLKTTSQKMFLPENKKRAILSAEEYYYKHYKKEMAFSRIEVRRLTDTIEKEYYYIIYFYLVDEPYCTFSILVDFDIVTGRCRIKDEFYLIEAMDGRMEKEVGKEIKKIYGKNTRICFSYDTDYIVDEETTLYDVKEKTQIKVILNFDRTILLEGNIKRDAKRLYSCDNQLKERGYKITRLHFHKEMVGTPDIFQTIEVNNLLSLQDAEKLLLDFFIKEEET